MTRLIPFEDEVGDDTAYIQFLEARVLQLEDSLRKLSQQSRYIGTPLSPVHFNRFRNHDEVFEIPHSHTRQVRIALENQSPDGDAEPGAEDFDERRHIHKDGGDPDAFNIIEYNPIVHLDPNRTGKYTNDQSNKHQLQTLSRFISFIDDLPKSQTWKDWVLALGKSQRREFLQDLVQSCGSGASGFASLGTPKSLKQLADEPFKSTDISILSEYAKFMVTFGIVNRQLACFRNIIFVSLCAVALKLVGDKDAVYTVMRKVLGSGADSKQLLKLVRGAKWANRLMSLLCETKWASRSWDILCVGMVAMIKLS